MTGCHDGGLRLCKPPTNQEITDLAAWQALNQESKTDYGIIEHYKQLQAQDYCPRLRNRVLLFVGEKIEASSMARASHNPLDKSQYSASLCSDQLSCQPITIPHFKLLKRNISLPHGN
jgi:hypothetical protein